MGSKANQRPLPRRAPAPQSSGPRVIAFAAIALVTLAAAGYLLVTAFAPRTPPPAANVIDIRADMGGFSVKETVRLVLGGGVVLTALTILAMHGNWQGGLAAFASHFWYAIPRAAAVIILSRLKPKARLLGAATYDEAGRVVQTQGDPCLGELVASGMVAALRDSGPDALQGLTLPSGASSYFVRQGSRAVVFSFSGPAPLKPWRLASARSPREPQWLSTCSTGWSRCYSSSDKDLGFSLRNRGFSRFLRATSTTG